jgi:pimeloyl-ACP methyl ester carboxylesterase
MDPTTVTRCVEVGLPGGRAESAAYLEVVYHEYVDPDPVVSRPVVMIPGVRSNAWRVASLLEGFARDARRHLVVPALNEVGLHGYQRLAARGTPFGAAHALNELMRHRAIARHEPVGSIDLAGFSGGAQFAHRFALVFPDYVHRLVVGAAGWYTTLDETTEYPQGLRVDQIVRPGKLDLVSFLHIPVLVAVGEMDIERDALLRRTPTLDRMQGRHRLARAVTWTEQVRGEAKQRGLPSLLELRILRGTGHSLTGAVDRGAFGTHLFEFMNRCLSLDD